MELSVESITFCCIFADVLKDLNNVILLVKLFAIMFTCVQLDILKYVSFANLQSLKTSQKIFTFSKLTILYTFLTFLS